MMNVTLPTLISRAITWHTFTETQSGGAGLYFKSCYDFDIHEKLSQSNHDISESNVVELIVYIYRHPTLISSFMNTF